MKTKQIILLYEDNKYGKPTKEKTLNEIIKIHLINREFEIHNGCFSFNTIEHVRGSLFRLDNDIFRTFDYCFKPKWYQYPKIIIYYVFKYFSKIKTLLNLF